MHSGKYWLRKRAFVRLLPVLIVALFAGVATADDSTSAPPDAVIELWEQHWTLNSDGSTEFYEKKHVRLNNDRVYGEFADPRITYNTATQKLEVINARVQRPDGTYRALANYSYVQTSPNSTSGWPAFAPIQQQVLVMGGIEEGCLVELEYRISGDSGGRDFFAGDIRLDDQHPIRERIIAVTAPSDVDVTARVLNTKAEADRDGGAQRWVFKDLPATPREPQAPPWRTSAPRFVFSTAESPEYWLDTTLQRIDLAASEGDLIARLAQEWTKGALRPEEKLRAIQEKLDATFNFVTFEVDLRPPNPRPALEVLSHSYGTPEEAAAAFLALTRAAGVPVRLGVLVGADAWVDSAPQRGFVEAYVLLHGPAENPQIWDAHHGRIVRNARWSNMVLLSPGERGMQRLPAWEQADESQCIATGAVKIDADGKLSGDLHIETTGLFVSPEALRSADGQKRQVNALVSRLLPDAHVKQHTVTVLDANRFIVEVTLAGDKPLPKIGQSYWLKLDELGPCRTEISFPLTHNDRKNPVHLAGAFEQQIELTVEWPEQWRVEQQPVVVSTERPSRGGPDSFAAVIDQSAEVEDNTLRLTRRLVFPARQLAADEFAPLRGMLNAWQADAGRSVILRP